MIYLHFDGIVFRKELLDIIEIKNSYLTSFGKLVFKEIRKHLRDCIKIVESNIYYLDGLK